MLLKIVVTKGEIFSLKYGNLPPYEFEKMKELMGSKEFKRSWVA